MEPLIGQIQMFGFNFAPRGWAFCNGQLLPISQNTALFSLLGTTYGGDGRTTFGLPDLRGRAPLHFGTGSGLSPVLMGQSAGVQNVTLSENNLPSHTHDIVVNGSTGEAETGDAVNAFPSSTTEDIYSSTTDTTMNAGMAVAEDTGGDQSVNIQNPFLGINFCIAIIGVFPSRN